MKKSLSKMMEAIADLPSIEQRLSDKEGTTAKEKGLDELPTGPRTGMGVATYSTKLEARIAHLEAKLKDAAAMNAAVHIPTDVIEPNPWQPRQFFEKEPLDSLKASILAYGVLTPIAVRPHPEKEGLYQLIAGERRTRAAQQMGLKTIPAVVLPMSDQEMGAQALAENIVRENLTDYEIGMALARVKDMFPKKLDMAETFGISRSQLYRYLAYAHLPGYVLQILHGAPASVAANLAGDLHAFLKGDTTESQKPRVEEVLQRLVKGELEQSKVMAELKKPAPIVTEKAPAVPDKTKAVVTSGGKKIGVLQRDSSTYSLKLKRNALSADLEAQLQAFLQGLFTLT